MLTRGLCYMKPYVLEFERKIRLYLDDHENTISFISSNLIDSLNPSVIEQDYDGEYVMLDLNFVTKEGVSCTLRVCFDVIHTESNDFVLADDVLQNSSSDNSSNHQYVYPLVYTLISPSSTNIPWLS